MRYLHDSMLEGLKGNNALSHHEREKILGRKPCLSIPSLREGTLDDVMVGDTIVFEEVEDGILRSCKGLQHFIRLKSYAPRVTVIDNHNHALYFWLEAIHDGSLEEGFELIHIDEHSDLWPNTQALPQDVLTNLDRAWEFTNFSCNVGNYIQPALENALIKSLIRIENEFQVDQYMNYIPQKNSVLNLDLDFFAPEMDFIPEKKKITLIQHLIPLVRVVTIATSPYFIDQTRAIEVLRKVLPP